MTFVTNVFSCFMDLNQLWLFFLSVAAFLCIADRFHYNIYHAKHMGMNYRAGKVPCLHFRRRAGLFCLSNGNGLLNE